MRRFQCPIRLSCEYQDTVSVEAETWEEAMAAALEEGKQLDIDKMDQDWSHVEVVQDEAFEVDEAGNRVDCKCGHSEYWHEGEPSGPFRMCHALSCGCEQLTVGEKT